jgi:mutator protein MutT
MKTIYVTCAIIEKNGEILIGERKDNGEFEFPGGKIEEGENEKECLIRELREELGILSNPYEILCRTEFEYHDKYVYLTTFLTEHTSGEIENKVHKRLLWVQPKNLHNYNFLPADKVIIDLLMKRFS